jgi:hypothetical protein
MLISLLALQQSRRRSAIEQPMHAEATATTGTPAPSGCVKVVEASCSALLDRCEPMPIEYIVCAATTKSGLGRV